MSLRAAAWLVIVGSILLVSAHPGLALIGILFVVLYGHQVREDANRP